MSRLARFATVSWQCARTQLGEGSRRGFFVLERLDPLPVHALHAAGAELIHHITALAPHAAIETRLLTS